MVVATMVVALAAPLAATASPGHGNGHNDGTGKGKSAVPSLPASPATPSGNDANTSDGNTWVADALLTKAKTNPDEKVRVIVQSSDGSAKADEAIKWLSKLAANSNQQDDFQGDNQDQSSLDLVGGVALTLSAKWVAKLQQVPGLTVTPDAMVKVSGMAAALKSTQLWPYATGNSQLWLGDQALYSSSTPAIAIIDSGVEQRADFGTRVIASVNLSSLKGNTSLNDELGHGTFVAGIAAGASPDLTGAAPTAPIVSIKVMDKNGMARTSDVIAACQWILDNKAKYNIRVANFSMHSSWGTNFYRDPLDRAVEKLWFSNVVVVAAAGNYGSAAGPSGVKYSPANDPFVITVGALDLGGTASIADDSVAPWSAYGSTYDGFAKPELAAPGRYMVGPVPAGSTVSTVKAQNMVGLDRIQLSGTSFAAPVVSGTVAQMLSRNPSWTPDQVKGALMRTARQVPINPRAAGVGQITATRAVTSKATPNPNAGLEQFLVTDRNSKSNGNGNGNGGNGSIPLFDARAWTRAAKADRMWNMMSWADQSWSDMSWAAQSWASMSWAEMSWAEMSWAEMSWAEMSWAEMSWADAAEGDATGTAGYLAAADQAAIAAADPNLAVPVDLGIPATLLPPALQPAVSAVLAPVVAPVLAPVVAPIVAPVSAADPAPVVDSAPAASVVLP
jgi:serine protease AprX